MDYLVSVKSGVMHLKFVTMQIANNKAWVKLGEKLLIPFQLLNHDSVSNFNTYSSRTLVLFSHDFSPRSL